MLFEWLSLREPYSPHLKIRDRHTHRGPQTQDRLTHHGTHSVPLALAVHILYQRVTRSHVPLHLDWAWRGSRTLIWTFCKWNGKGKPLSVKLGPFQALCPFQSVLFAEMSEEQKGRDSDVMKIWRAIGWVPFSRHHFPGCSKMAWANGSESLQKSAAPADGVLGKLRAGNDIIEMEKSALAQ